MKAVLLALALVACKGDPKPTPVPKAPADAPARLPDPTLTAEQDEYVADVMAFTNQTLEQVRARMKLGSKPLKQEWETWEARGEMTDERIKEFYKQTTNYIYELGEWHLFVDDKRQSDLALVQYMREHQPKNILDFGGGAGLTAIPLARAGFDVTLADLEGASLDFAAFRAKRHGIPLKLWRSDVEAMPPDATYDVILALDVLEHLPAAELEAVVTKLVSLKTEQTTVIMSAPFGRTSVHPMHLDSDEHTEAQVERLRTELPKP